MVGEQVYNLIEKYLKDIETCRSKRQVFWNGAADQLFKVIKDLTTIEGYRLYAFYKLLQTEDVITLINQLIPGTHKVQAIKFSENAVWDYIDIFIEELKNPEADLVLISLTSDEIPTDFLCIEEFLKGKIEEVFEDENR